MVKKKHVPEISKKNG